jgi:hypothetical protein
MKDLFVLPLLVGFASGLAVIGGGAIVARWLQWRRNRT